MEELGGSKSWEKFYNSCPMWGYLFRETQDPDAVWPRGLRWELRRLFFREKLCIPLCLQKPFIRKTHACLGHANGKRLWEQMSLTTEWAQEEEARRFTMCVSRQCETCQACDPPGYTHGFLIPLSRPELWSALRWISFGYPWCCPVGKVSTVWLCVWTDIQVGLWRSRVSTKV